MPVGTLLVPSKKPNANAVDRDRIDLRIAPEMRSRAQEQADRYGMSLSAYIKQALVQRIEADEATQPGRDEAD